VQALAATSERPAEAQGIALTPLQRVIDDAGYHYTHVNVAIDRKPRIASITLRAPREDPPADGGSLQALGDRWWPLTLARELDDAILMLRTNDLEIGTWVFRTEGDPRRVLATDAFLAAHAGHWLVRETVGLLRRTLARLEVSSRSMIALVEPGSCFAGTLLEPALAADRIYMLDSEEADAPCMFLSEMNFGPYETVGRVPRIAARFCFEPEAVERCRAAAGRPLDTKEALDLGLVTAAPDTLDWDDEVRLVLEERTSLSPDALTGMEASLRFGPVETQETRIFGRLSAWQNWIFSRPNAVGERGALRVYGTGLKPEFDWQRV